jgi:hypothetical protein
VIDAAIHGGKIAIDDANNTGRDPAPRQTERTD